jgi:hypothetical protein
LTAYERNLRKGLAAVRRVYRRADTAGEKLERTLRRLYNRKTVPKSRKELATMIAQYYSYKQAVLDLEQSLAKDYVGYVE